MSETREGKIQSIIIFDGVCNLCNGFVGFVSRRDKKKRFLFLSNQSTEAKDALRAAGQDEPDDQTVYLIEAGRVFQRSTAALRVLKELKFPWPLFYCFILIPSCLRDPVYRFIARRRYQWFGKRSKNA